MRVDNRYKLFWRFPVKLSLFSKALLSRVAGRCVITVDLWNFISFPEIFAGGNHPICELEHGPLAHAGAIDLRTDCQSCKLYLFHFVPYTLAVVFCCLLIQKGVHLMLLLRNQLGPTQ